MNVIADVVLNHMYSYQVKDYEINPVLENYFNNEAVIRDTFRYPYPANEVVWSIIAGEDTVPEVYFKGFSMEKWLDWDGTYILVAAKSLTAAQKNESIAPIRLNENTIITADNTYLGKLPDPATPISAKLHFADPLDTLYLNIRLRNENAHSLEWTDQARGIRMYADSVNSDFRISLLTSTGIPYVAKQAEPQLSWHYPNFHPGDSGDYLESAYDNDEVRERIKWFGHDLNHQHPYVLSSLSGWGKWLLDTVGYDGFRFDFVTGIDPVFMVNWINFVWDPRYGQIPMVGEYFSQNKQGIVAWSEKVNAGTETGTPVVKVFDFPLKFELNKLCNLTSEQYDMEALRHAGLLFDPNYNLAADQIISFVENHDTGKESDKWLLKDWDMAYAYILFAPPQPCVFYNHYFGITQTDFMHQEKMIEIPESLRKQIDLLIKLRTRILGGEMFPLDVDASIRKHIYAAIRPGQPGTDGALLLLNNHDTDTLTFKLNPDQKNSPDWNGKELRDIFGKSSFSSEVQSGVFEFRVPPRSAAVFVTKENFGLF